MTLFELLRTIWRDTCETIGQHYVIAIVVTFVIALAAFGWQAMLATIAVMGVLAFIMYQLPDDHDPFGPNGPRGV